MKAPRRSRVPLAAAGVLAMLTSALGFGADGGSAGLRFANIAPQAGLEAVLLHGGPAKDWIFEANGSGVAVFDYDRDGFMDVLIVNGSTLEHLRSVVLGKPVDPPTRGVYLYRNNGEGKFEDVTGRAGLACPYWGTGANAADVDNDGHIDILITTIGRDLLFRNNGGGTFSDISAKSGLSREIAWHTGSSWGDYDGDGDLDLYVAGYVDIKELDLQAAAPVCNYRGLPAFCGPKGLQSERDFLYQNQGNGTFHDVSEAAGIRAAPPRHGFTPVFADFDQDGRVDVFVANDSDPNFLFLNQGDGTFKESALSHGVAYNANGQTQANMGAAVGDYDADGDLDILTTTFSEDYFPLFQQQSDGFFEDVSFQAGLGVATITYLGWGCGFADLDNDGDRDLWLANGHVYPTIDKLGSSAYLQPVVVFENAQSRFQPIRLEQSGVPENSFRAGAAADFNNDGLLDLLILPLQGKPVLLENRTANGNSWIGFRLEGRKSPEAIGASVEIESCGKKQRVSVFNGGSYLSKADPRPHFGLGECRQVDRVTIRWPGGAEETRKSLEVNQWVTVKQPN